jgi:CubicO group peptidase (beta-lactamase class C family)
VLLAVGGTVVAIAAAAWSTRAARGPGAAVAFVRNGHATTNSRGLADRTTHAPITSDTRFELASVTKLFTALAVLRRVERGQLGLDDAVARHVAGLPDWSNAVRLRHLLTHTDGLPDDVSPDRLASVRELLFPAGSRCVYGDSGYRLLARIVELAAGRRFGDVLHDEFFVPLHMTRTVVDDGRDPTLERGAVGHHRGLLRTSPVDKLALEVTSGDSGVLSTADDLAKFAAALDEPTFLSPASRELVLTRARLDDGTAASFACGFAIGSIAGHACARHTGGWAGFRTLFAWFPEERAAVVVLANVDDFDVDAEARRLVEQELGRR